MNIITTPRLRGRLGRSLAALAVAAGTGTFVLAGGTALAAPAGAGGSITGPETISGTVRGEAALANVTIIPLKFQGIVVTTGKIDLGSQSNTLTTAVGKLVVDKTGTQQSQTANSTTCRETYTNYVTVTFLGAKSTGSFAGVTGPGAAEIFFAAIAPRYTSGTHKGECNFSNNAQPGPNGALVEFLAAGVFTTH
jgi:hypothetical protein